MELPVFVPSQEIPHLNTINVSAVCLYDGAGAGSVFICLKGGDIFSNNVEQ
jgi:hypothetical protein